MEGIRVSSQSVLFQLMRAAVAPAQRAPVPNSEQNPTASLDVEDAAVVNISERAKQLAAANSSYSRPQAERKGPVVGTEAFVRDAEQAKREAESKEIQELKQRDREVRAHEQAHANALGRYKTGGPRYEYESGPDGVRYAVSGSVPVDISAEAEPEQTIEKAQTIRQAAQAPAEPSAADRKVAAQAMQLEAQARAELVEQQKEEQKEAEKEGGADGGESPESIDVYA